MKYDQIIKDLQRFLGKDEKIIKIYVFWENMIKLLKIYNVFWENMIKLLKIYVFWENMIELLKNLQRFLGKFGKINKNIHLFLIKLLKICMFSGKI